MALSQGFVELAQAATRSEQRLTKEIELERRSSSALQGRTAALKDKAAATLQDFATRLEYTQEVHTCVHACAWSQWRALPASFLCKAMLSA